MLPWGGVARRQPCRRPIRRRRPALAVNAPAAAASPSAPQDFLRDALLTQARFAAKRWQPGRLALSRTTAPLGASRAEGRDTGRAEMKGLALSSGRPALPRPAPMASGGGCAARGRERSLDRHGESRNNRHFQARLGCRRGARGSVERRAPRFVTAARRRRGTRRRGQRRSHCARRAPEWG